MKRTRDYKVLREETQNILVVQKYSVLFKAASFKKRKLKTLQKGDIYVCYRSVCWQPSFNR